MTGRKLNKVEGAKEKCFCGSPIVCVKITYQGQDQLQWQNADGKAHYNARNEDGTFPPCNSTVKKEEKTNPNVTTNRIDNPPTTQSALNPPKPTDSVLAADCERIYRSLIPAAERTVREALYFGKQPTDHDVIVSTQCVMKSFIQLWIELSK